jgi:hypothetical protein
MHAAVKRFSQDSTNLQTVLLSMLAAALSLQLTSLNPLTQFLVVSAAISSLTLLFFHLYEKKHFREVFIIVNASGVILLTETPGNLAVFSILSLLILPARNLKGLYASAFLAHLGDAMTTIVSIKDFSGESNPFMRFFMERVGVLPALLSSKALLVGLPLLFGYLNFKGDERRLFGKTVLIIGLSLAARNLLLVF